MAYNIKLQGKNLAEAESLLKEVGKIFSQHKVKYALDGGTLLGIRRDNKLLPWDNDVDFCVLDINQEEIATLCEALRKANFRVRFRYVQKDHPPYFKRGDLRMIKIRKKRFFGLLKGNVCLDVFVKYRYKQNYYWLIGDNVIKSVDSAWYANMKTIDFQGLSHPKPSPLDGYLKARYGNWEIPNENYNTFVDDNSVLDPATDKI